MNRYYVYIFSRDGEQFHVGFCKDLRRTIQSYEELPSIEWPERKNRLVYVELANSKEEAQQQFDELIHLTKQAKIALIERNQINSQLLASSLNDTLHLSRP